MAITKYADRWCRRPACEVVDSLMRFYKRKMKEV